MRKCVLCCIAVTLLLTTARVRAQDSYDVRALKYIGQYSSLAILEQKKNGIPAAITLGQGILETEAGASELMTQANNHFGIKCGNGWEGPTFSHTDDAPDECFKKYKCAEDSYRDHSEHLKRNPRYSPLFDISETDYAGWAKCLKKCGYATNPKYAQELIKIIEDYKLQAYTYAAMDNTWPADAPGTQTAGAAVTLNDEPDDTDKKEVVDTIAAAKQEPYVEPIKKTADSARGFISRLSAPGASADSNSIAAGHNGFENSKLVTVNGLKAFYAYKDEMLLQYAVKFKVHYPKLLEMNDLPDAPLTFNTYVYVEKKHASGTHAVHAVKEGETMLMIAQAEGMQLKRLLSLNRLKTGEEPATGATIELQFPARQRPPLQGSVVVAHKNTTGIIVDSTPKQENDLVLVTSQGNMVHVDASQPVEATQPATAANNAPAAADNAATAESQPETQEAKEESLAKLKAELDKVVYADDSKLIAKKEPAPAAAAQSKPVNVAAAPDTEKAGKKYYTVKRGDTAFSIAKRNNVALDDLMKWNNITDGGVKVGQRLKVKE